ncbi:MAG: class II aldolase/adducin family protein [Alphaproteobacteria bacterium]|nr:class II aldolase/adducin family protein [Alphaproteobacteria bacterium]MBU0796955.1 class II aldolase/adducin family protein [Alphaproteobacteria bacterium]MBU0888330.1 class II aldolase/adducin family protein [Alphaproteobacteria bacterium]MBU1814641.1 class II aldolase/adducin family protein [Alphaproteobacteria bacterium]
MSVSTDEQILRRDLAATCRLFGLYRLAHVDDGRITLRCAGGVLAKPDDVAFDRMTAADAVFIPDAAATDPETRVDADTLAIHRAVLAARPEAMAIIEVTGSAAGAVASGQAGVLPISQFSMQFYNRLGVEELAGAGDNQDAGRRTAAALGQHLGVIRRHRGMLVCGRTVPEAFVFMFYLIRSCQIQVQAMTGGGELVLPSDAVAEHTARQYERDPTPGGKREWPALLRLVERVAPGFDR